MSQPTKRETLQQELARVIARLRILNAEIAERVNQRDELDEGRCNLMEQINEALREEIAEAW